MKRIKRTAESEAAEMRAIDPAGIGEPYPTTEQLREWDKAQGLQFPLSAGSRYTRSMKRTITAHRDGGLLNNCIRITKRGRRTKGGAFPTYVIKVRDKKNRQCCEDVYIDFQNGDPAKSINGISREALLAVVADSLADLQAGACPCRENAAAIYLLCEALAWLQKRARDRAHRGVTGKVTP